MKIQINSLEALERLIGGDSELEIEVRNSVVQNFAKKHLKSVAQTFTQQQLNTLVRKTFQEQYMQKKGWNTYVLKPGTRLDQAVDEAVGKYVRDRLEKVAEKVIPSEEAIKDLVEARVEIRLNRIAENFTKQAIDAKARKLILEKFKE